MYGKYKAYSPKNQIWNTDFGECGLKQAIGIRQRAVSSCDDHLSNFIKHQKKGKEI